MPLHPSKRVSFYTYGDRDRGYGYGLESFHTDINHVTGVLMSFSTHDGFDSLKSKLGDLCTEGYNRKFELHRHKRGKKWRG